MEALNKISNSIIFEDNHLLIVNKQAGILSQRDHTGDDSLVDLLKSYMKVKYNKPGNVYLGLAHRLDRPVSGAIICCKTSKSLTRINKMIKQRQIEKIYHALCLNAPDNKSGQVESYLIKDTVKNFVTGFVNPKEGAKKAILNYQYLQKSNQGHHLLEVILQTGRPHQIRVQLNSISCPILGDVKYKKQKPLPDKSIALHARQLSFEHPVTKEKIKIIADYPKQMWWNL